MSCPSSDVVSVPYSIDAFRFRPTSLPKHSSFLGSWYSLVLALSLTTVSLTPCRNGMAGHHYAGGGQLLPGSTICPGFISSALGGTLRLGAGPHAASSVLTVASSLGSCCSYATISFSSGFISKSVTSTSTRQVLISAYIGSWSVFILASLSRQTSVTSRQAFVSYARRSHWLSFLS
jgi:hypothetical protein